MQCKFLGVQLDSKVSFRPHIQYIIGKISKHVGILWNHRDSLPISTRLDYYYSFIYPYLSYNIAVWGGTYGNALTPLITLQKKIIRIMKNAKFRDPTSLLFYDLGLLKLSDIYTLHLVTYMHKAVSKGEYSIAHNLNTRNIGAAQPRFHRLTLTQHSVSYAGPTAWNQLPQGIRSIEKLWKFKKTVKNYLLSKYV